MSMPSLARLGMAVRCTFSAGGRFNVLCGDDETREVFAPPLVGIKPGLEVGPSRLRVFSRWDDLKSLEREDRRFLASCCALWSTPRPGHGKSGEAHPEQGAAEQEERGHIAPGCIFDDSDK